MFHMKTMENFFSKNEQMEVKRVFDLVHSNICGPFTTKSLRGAKYFITFINDKNMTMEIRTFKNKDQILKHFGNSKIILNKKSKEK